MIPKIVHFGLFGGWKLSPIGEACVESWKKVLPDYEIKLWNDDNVPKDSQFFVDALKHKPVNASHWAQYWALHEFGGVFMDNDVLSIKPFDLNHGAFAGFQRSDIWEHSINNAVMGCVPKHPLLARILKRLESAWGGDWPLWSGPGILTDELLQMGLSKLNVDQKVSDVMVYDKERFYPWFHNEPPIPKYKLTERTFACHMWEGSWLHKP